MRAPMIVAALVAILQSLPGVAADTALTPLNSANDSRRWSGIGRIDFGGEAFCTGSLIAPDLVLTAAHCIYHEDGTPYDPSQIQFRAGWRNGSAVAFRGVTRAIGHPDFQRTRKDPTHVAHDLALLRLDNPIALSLADPLVPEHSPNTGASVGVVSYAFDRADVPSLQQICHVLDRQSGVLVLSCDIDFGSSGAPVFTFVNGTPRIVSVISAKAEANQRKVALGTDLEAPLEELKGLLAKSEGVYSTPTAEARHLAVTTPRATQGDVRITRGGAKFLRP